MSKKWPLESYKLTSRSHEEVAAAIRTAFQDNYANVAVDVVNSVPDLRQKPYNLLCEGLSGREVLIDVGGVDNLFPQVNVEKEYCMEAVVKEQIDYGDHFHLLGCGSCGYSLQKQNSELVMVCDEEKHKSKSGIMVNNHKDPKVVDYKSYRVSALANLFLSEGKNGTAIHFRVSKRTGKFGDVIACVQDGLKKAFGEDCVTVGGVLIQRGGTANIHVMSDFTTEPIRTAKFIDDVWLKYYHHKCTPDNPMTYMSVCSSVNPPGANLRLTHTHGYSADNKLAGHYHYETDESALDADYEGYFNIAKSIWRVDNLPQAPNFDKIVDYPTVQSSAPGTPMPPALNGASKL